MIRTVQGIVFSGVLFAIALSLGCQQTPPATTETAANVPAPPPAKPAAAGTDVTASDASVDVGAVRVTMSVPQRPIVAGEKRRFCVRTEVDAIAVELHEGRMSFDTDPPTSVNRQTLTASQDGCYSAEVTLPAGTTRGYATVEGIVDEHPLTARFQFDVAK